MKPGTKADNQLLSEAYNQMQGVEEGGASAQEMNALRQVVDGLRSGRIGLKEVEQGAGTIVVSTGDEKSVILKVVGYEGDHDIPISQRPDKPRVSADDFGDESEFDQSKYDDDSDSWP